MILERSTDVFHRNLYGSFSGVGATKQVEGSWRKVHQFRAPTETDLTDGGKVREFVVYATCTWIGSVYRWSHASKGRPIQESAHGEYLLQAHIAACSLVLT